MGWLTVKASPLKKVFVMKFEHPLQAATLVRRYKRFLADVRCADGRELTLHCPNTGSMRNCCDPHSRVWFRDSQNPKRKYPSTWELVEVQGRFLACVNTGRANGLVQLNDGLSLVIAPALAGVILVTFGLGGVLITDVATFFVAVGTLLMVRFPRPKRDPSTATGSLLGDAVAGWRYISDRPGLFGLLWIYAGVNFALSFANVLIIPLVLAFASEAGVGAMFSTIGIGAVLGSIAVSAWGGPKRRVRGTMISIGLVGLGVAVVGLSPTLLVVGIGGFTMMAVVPVANTASQVIWQTKVPPALQGRVFAIRRMIASAISPLAIIAAGPLADRVFEPLMAEGGSLAGSVGSIIGTGPGRGVAVMFILSGMLVAVMAVVGYALPKIRNLETELPDHLEDA